MMSNKEYLESYRKSCKQIARGEKSVIDFLNKRLDIESSIADMEDGLESLIIHMRYIQLKTWNEICDYLWLSRSQVMRVHKRVIENIVLDEVRHEQKS